MNKIYHIMLESFESAHNYLHWLTTEQFDFIKQNFTDLECSLKAFISYNAKDKRIAAVVKKAFSILGIDSFMAHEDIKPSEEWKGVIVEELKNCNLFAPIITKNFMESDWTDQESGAAYIREMTIVPISIALEEEDFVDPYGFIGDYQALKHRIQNNTLSEDHLLTDASISMCAELSKAFLSKETIIEEVRNCFVESFLNSTNFSESNSKSRFLNSLGQFNNNQLKLVIIAYALNDQIRNAAGASSLVRMLIDKNLSSLDDATKDFWAEIVNKR